MLSYLNSLVWWGTGIEEVMSQFMDEIRCLRADESMVKSEICTLVLDVLLMQYV
jgi:hypothetical protein